MNPAGLMSRTATITRRIAGESKDEYGNPVPSEMVLTVACELQQKDSQEMTVDSDRQRTDWNLFTAPSALNSLGRTVDTTFDGGDVITIDGVTYEAYGPPWPARNPRTQAVTHLQAEVRRTV